MINEIEIIDGIKVLSDYQKTGKHTAPSGKKYIISNIGWVAGFTYHDGMEWLFAKTDWASLRPDALKKDQALVLKSKEAASKHTKKFQSTIEKYEVFVRPYQRQSFK